MITSNNPTQDPPSKDVGLKPPDPIEPGRRIRTHESEIASYELQKNRADVVLLFGILSLCFCWPLGLVAWIMGTSDLRKIKAGKMSGDKVGVLKVGMGLGLLGMLLTLAAFVFAILFAHRLPDKWPDFGDLFTKQPLAQDQMIYVGEWRGDKGSLITIRSDGTGDFKTKNTKVTGGKVKIEGETLSIGLFGFASTWRIDKPPRLENGSWTMKLGGEKFTRKAEGSLV